MRKILIIANREYRAMVATKAFVITLVLMPILMGGGIFFQERLRQRVNLDEKRMVVLDQTGALFEAMSEAAEARNKTAIFDPATGAQIKPCYRLERGPGGKVTDEAAAGIVRAHPPRRDPRLRGDSRGRVRHFFVRRAAPRRSSTLKTWRFPRRRAGSSKRSTTPSGGIGSSRRRSTPRPSIAPALG